MEELAMKKAWDNFCQSLTEKRIKAESVTPKNTKKHYAQIRSDEVNSMAAYQRAKSYYIR